MRLAAATGTILAAAWPCMVLRQWGMLSQSRMGSLPMAVGYKSSSAPISAIHLAVSGNH